MDFITALPVTRSGNTGIFTIVDRFSKMAHFLPLRDTATAPDVAKLFLDHIIKLHGVPNRIVSDRDSRFTGKFWSELMTALGVQLSMSTAYHPQTDG